MSCMIVGIASALASSVAWSLPTRRRVPVQVNEVDGRAGDAEHGFVPIPVHARPRADHEQPDTDPDVRVDRLHRAGVLDDIACLRLWALVGMRVRLDVEVGEVTVEVTSQSRTRWFLSVFAYRTHRPPRPQ
jgi:hypothetical protein